MIRRISVLLLASIIWHVPACQPGSDPDGQGGDSEDSDDSDSVAGGSTATSGGKANGDGGKANGDGGKGSSTGGKKATGGQSTGGEVGGSTTSGGSSAQTGGAVTGGGDLGGEPNLGGDSGLGGETALGGETGLGGDGAGGASSLACESDVSGAVVQDQPGGKCYIFYPTRVSWDDAREFCQDTGGDLASLSDSTIRDFLNGTTFPSNSAWIGGSDVAVEGDFQWLNGQPWVGVPWRVNYDYWWYYYYGYYRSEPNGGTNENCVERYSSDGTFNDLPCSALDEFLCEYEQGPSE